MMLGGTHIAEPTEDEKLEATDEMSEAVMQAIMSCCTNDDGSVTVSTDVIFRSLILTLGVFMAVNPGMDHRPTRRAICNDACRALGDAILSARQDIKAGDNQSSFGMH